MITFRHKGNFEKTSWFLTKAMKRDYFNRLKKYAEEGVNALASATPKDSGNTASCWDYEIKMGNGYCQISWFNTNVNDGVNIALILQYGHGTGTGGYVVGVDYINPTMAPIFDKIANEAWKEVVSP